ncbi:MAG TPA: 3'-5' exonuclease, partial [Armatimonadetes bacterium]|nr:3'-5' exonuclease [Armatimonadota bacterium]
MGDRLPAFAGPAVLGFLENCDLAGFNIARFDVPFLQTEMQRAGTPLDLQNTRLVDAQVIFHKNEPRNLAAAYRFYCNGEHIDAHDAMGDVRVTLEILDAQLKKYSSLPKNTDGLHRYCTSADNRFVTSDRKFLWKEGEA